MKLLALLMLLPLCFTSKAQDLHKVLGGEGSFYQRARLVIGSEPKEKTLAPQSYQEFTSASRITFKAGVKIRPGDNGWFKAKISQKANVEKEPWIHTTVSRVGVYPNPVLDQQVTIVLDNSVERFYVSFISLGGKFISGMRRLPFSGRQAQLSLENGIHGLYLMMIELENEVLYKKIHVN